MGDDISGMFLGGRFYSLVMVRFERVEAVFR